MTEIDWFLKEGEKDVKAAGLMNEGFFKLSVSSFDELVKHSGKAKALAAVRPYQLWGAQNTVNEAIRKLNIQSDGPDAMLLVHQFVGIGLVPTDKMEGEIKEKGGIGMARDCIFRSASPELCWISHITTEVEAEVINPEYECIWTHHESNGDPYCRFVFKRKADPISVLDDLGRTLAVLPKFEVTKEEVMAARLKQLGGLAYLFTCAFRDLHGEKKTMEIIGGLAKNIGRELGARLIRENPEMKGSVVSVGKLVRAMQNAMGQWDNFVIVSEGKVENEITDCSISSVPNIPDAMCMNLQSFFKGMVSAIDPDLEFHYDRMITKGDKDCHWVIEKKPQAP